MWSAFMSTVQHIAGPRGYWRGGGTWAGRGPLVEWACSGMRVTEAGLGVAAPRCHRSPCHPRVPGSEAGDPGTAWPPGFEVSRLPPGAARARPPRGPSRHWPPGRTRGAGGQTWSHAGPAVTSLFLPALSQALLRRPDAHFQSQRTHGLNMGIQRRYTFAFFFFFPSMPFTIKNNLPRDECYLTE